MGNESPQSTGAPAAGHLDGREAGCAVRAEAARRRLVRLARNHGLLLLVAILSFAAADIWSARSGLLVAELFSITTAVLAGFTVATLVHEWFHYGGARLAKARIRIPRRQGLFVFVWDFDSNTADQFFLMSVAGSIGGVLAVMLLWTSVPADTLARAVLRSTAVASFIYSAMIEWPVIKRSRYSGDPLGELSKIDKPLLRRSFIVATLSGIALIVLLMY